MENLIEPIKLMVVLENSEVFGRHKIINVAVIWSESGRKMRLGDQNDV